MHPAHSSRGNPCGLTDLLGLLTEPAAEFHAWEPARGHASVATRTAPASVPAERDLDAGELRYLTAVVEEPGRPSSAYPRLARLSNRRTQAIRDKLAALGYVRLHRVSLSARGRSSIVIAPLEPALIAVRHSSTKASNP